MKFGEFTNVIVQDFWKFLRSTGGVSDKDLSQKEWATLYKIYMKLVLEGEGDTE